MTSLPIMLGNATTPLVGADNQSANGVVVAGTSDCVVFRFIIYTLITGVMCLTGLLGNSLAILVLRRDRTTPVASFLLQCLALADNCYLAVWLLHFAVRDLFKYVLSDCVVFQIKYVLGDCVVF
jgi:hypothetical protein